MRAVYTLLNQQPWLDIEPVKIKRGKRLNHKIKQFFEKAPQLIDYVYSAYFDPDDKNPLEEVWINPYKSHKKRKKASCKIFSFHLDEVDCFNKLKMRKSHEFGRQYQIGRLQGNFVWSIPNNSLRMPDAENLLPMLREHQRLFNCAILSVSTDRGYYAKANEQALLASGIPHVAMPKADRRFKDPPNNPLSEEEKERLSNRRSGIEPIIGHLKRSFQMGRSRMKSDKTTEASGYCALLGFNLRQMMRYLTNQVQPPLLN